MAIGLSRTLHLILGFLVAYAGAASVTARASWPNGPFTTNGRWVVDASGLAVTYGVGINSIRLTYATEMIDQIESNGGVDVSVQAALVAALGQDNGTAVFEKVLSHNPSFSSNTTRLEVFDAVAAAAQENEVYIHLDNHLSKAGWCCNPLDGNTWWGDEYFSVTNWTRGLTYMADHAKAWPNLMSMSLRNELRQPFLNATLYEQSYNWQDWYKYVKQGVEAISSVNADVLIFLSGLESDTTLEPVTNGTALAPGSEAFNIDDFPVNKIVLELHNYANILGGSSSKNCTALEQDLLQAGFNALQNDSHFCVLYRDVLGRSTGWLDDLVACWKLLHA
ncbi:hypothetical protein KJ359_006902 [Pestalotiopsis sp. 9143b]|nr:hypothetical protein KJ359_006902 [Pestalotiopsis sp. 9143b]